MKLRTFIAPTLAQAKEKVRAELGEDAIIISSASTPGGGVEIRAAIEATRPMRKAETDKAALTAALEQRIVTKVLEQLKVGGAQRAGGRSADEPPHIGELRAVLARHQLGDDLTQALMEAASRVETKDVKAALSVALNCTTSWLRGSALDAVSAATASTSSTAALRRSTAAAVAVSVTSTVALASATGALAPGA